MLIKTTDTCSISYHYKWEDPVKDDEGPVQQTGEPLKKKTRFVFIAVWAMSSHISCITRKRILAACKPEIKLIFWLIPTTASQVSSLRIIIFNSSWLLKLKLVLWHPRIIFHLSLQRIICLVSLMNGSLQPVNVNAAGEFVLNRNWNYSSPLCLH